MNKLLKKTAVVVSSGVFLLATSVPVFATDVTIEGNGADSNNTVKITQSCKTKVTQQNSLSVNTSATAIANSGENQANQNTGGDTSITTGDANAAISVVVGGNVNDATVNPCCCDGKDGSQTVEIIGNGFDSTNKVTKKDSNSLTISQKNKKWVKTNAWVKSNTGKNKTNKNTGGDTSTDTGTATSGLLVEVTGDTNTLNP